MSPHLKSKATLLAGLPRIAVAATLLIKYALSKRYARVRNPSRYFASYIPVILFAL